MKQPCECCGIFKSVGVASSGLGAISLAYCKYCIMFRAEPESLVRFTVHNMNRGWENTAPWVRYITIPVGPMQYIFADQLI
jgi:hypothetical protein